VCFTFARKMKLRLLTLGLAILLTANGISDEKSQPKIWGDFHDPRQTISLYEWIDDGVDVEETRSISNSILIICWMPDKDGKYETYQISGIEGKHSRSHVEKFLKEFYKLELPKEAGRGPLNVMIAGNNWGAGMGLKETLVKLSKKHSFSVFYAGGWTFQKAVLTSEPAGRLKLIKEAHKLATSESGRR